MHPKILKFPNKLFYNNNIKSIINENEMLKEEIINYMPFLNKKIPLLFYHLNSNEEITSNCSYKNELEVENNFPINIKINKIKSRN